MNRVRVAVFPSGSEVSIEVSRALKYQRNIDLVGLSSICDYGQVAFPINYDKLPYYDDNSFLEALIPILKKYKIDFIIPGMDEAAFLLKLNEHHLPCKVIYAELDVAKIIRRKSDTYNSLKDLIPVPKLLSPEKLTESQFPIFTKPDIGYGSRGAQKINKLDDLKQLLPDAINNNIFMEYLPGSELTVDCFSDTTSNLLFVGPRIRERTRLGISVSTSPIEDNPVVNDIAKKISRHLRMSGCWFFQLKADASGEYKLLEVASRVSGSMAMYRMLGINFILLDIYQRLGKIVTVPKVISRAFRLERAFDVNLVGKLDIDSIYVDLDDCLIIKDKVNTKLLSFLYTCINKSLPVFLVTRHNGNLENTLSKFRLSGIFDETFHLLNNEPKSSVINHESPLFIDDSHRERESVRKEKGCISIAPDMVDEGVI